MQSLSSRNTLYSFCNPQINYTPVEHRDGVCARKTAHAISNNRLGIMAGEKTRLLVSYAWKPRLTNLEVASLAAREKSV